MHSIGSLVLFSVLNDYWLAGWLCWIPIGRQVLDAFFWLPCTFLCAQWLLVSWMTLPNPYWRTGPLFWKPSTVLAHLYFSLCLAAIGKLDDCAESLLVDRFRKLSIGSPVFFSVLLDRLPSIWLQKVNLDTPETGKTIITWDTFNFFVCSPESILPPEVGFGKDALLRPKLSVCSERGENDYNDDGFTWKLFFRGWNGSFYSLSGETTQQIGQISFLFES